METFEWSTLFETGLADVDQQHKRLVELVNYLGRNAQNPAPEQIDGILKELADYTVYHFSFEEGIMRQYGVFSEHSIPHQKTHQEFIRQVQIWLDRRRGREPVSLQHLLEFLANWLVFHILGDDRSLGRQVLRIQTGLSPREAFEQDSPSNDPRTVILLAALERLYSGLVARNEDLLASQRSLSALNETLEHRVAERTAELVEANHRLRKEQEKALEAEKMASLGRMVAGFAHEVNTPIGVAVAVASQARDLVAELEELLSQDEVSEEDFRSRLQMLDEASDLALVSLRRAADMVRSFRRTAVDQSSDLERDYDVAEVIEDVHKSLHNAFKNTPIRILVSCAPGLSAYGPAGALVQILSNLLHNSRTHGFADGTQPGKILIHAAINGDQICIDYRDDGSGMTAETLKHAFEPFYTTRRSSGGSGLGLYISYTLVTQALHGSIRCESETGQGARFIIQYPRYLAGSTG